MRNRFDEDLENLHLLQVKMGAVCENMLRNLDSMLKMKIVDANFEKDEISVLNMSRSIENLSLELMIRHQPVAKDLRDISSSFKIVYDFRRIAIQSLDIKEIYDTLTDSKNAKEENLFEISDTVINQLKYTINLIIKRDPSLCEKITELDDQTDEIFTKIKLDYIEKMKYNIGISGDLVNMLMIAKYYEKIGDHCVNIANNMYFSITGNKKAKI